MGDAFLMNHMCTPMQHPTIIPHHIETATPMQTYHIGALVSLLKVFDANYFDHAHASRLNGLNPNDRQDLSTACNTFLQVEYLAFSDGERQDFIDIIGFYLKQPDCGFDDLFASLALVFDEEIRDQRKFMSHLLAIIRAYEAAHA